MKKVFTIFCLLVLSLQALPVKQIGAILASNQITEELPHSMDAKGKLPLGKEDPFIASSFFSLNVVVVADNAYFHFAVSLPPSHPGEIHTPPPNIA